MSEAEEVKFDIKVVINKEKTKVLFAEAGCDFTDVLLSFLILPLGTIVEVLEKRYGDKAPVIGSFTSLYRGAKNLDSVYFTKAKEHVISSTLFEEELCSLKLNIRGTQPTASSRSRESNHGVLTGNGASFIITDDLRVLPDVSCSIIQTLTKIGIAVEDMDGTEKRKVSFGLNEIVALLKESLVSVNPLTALIFPGRREIVATEGPVLLPQICKSIIRRNPQKMLLHVMLQISTNKFLFAQSHSNFVDFLFGMLNTPLGRAIMYVNRNTGVKNMDNLHRSATQTDHSSNGLMRGEILIHPNPNKGLYNLGEYNVHNSLMNAQCWVLRARMFMVSDDLTVAPLGVTSGLSIINQLKIPFSDIKEVDMLVGLEEAMNILKASFTSTTALTDGLIKPFLGKQELNQQSESETEEQMELVPEADE